LFLYALRLRFLRALASKINIVMDNRPRIGIDVTAALAQGGGIGRYTRELIRAVAASDAPFQYRLFSARPPDQLPVPNPLPQADHVSHHPAPLSEKWLYRLWYRLRLPLPVQLVTGGLELFHSPDFVLPPVYGRIPTVLTVHDLSFIHYPHTFPKVLVDYLNRVVPWSVRRASHILADSEATRQDLLGLWQVPAEKVTVLYSGVNASFRPTDEETVTAVRQRYGLADAPYLLSVGTVQPRKNYQMLIQAFAGVAANWPHTLAIAGGKGWLYEEMLAEIERQRLNGRVRFIGFVDDADLPALYTGADLFLFPSLYEGFGLPLLEAMACGVPVLTSNASCLPEVVVNRERGVETAVLLSPHAPQPWSQAMQQLLADEPARARLRQAGQQQAARFTWQQAAHRLIQLYRQLLPE
jgi:glycosyltransferase involved in cell wall biosynthesis